MDHADLPGIIYNNCAVGGAQFSHICNNASYALGQIEDLNPDLIILSYGSNDSYTTKFNGNLYHKMVGGFIDSLKLLLPKTNFILTSPPDTRSKDRFPRNVDSIQLVFHQLSQEKDIAYWDLRTQMGGNGSLYTWLKNGLAAKDKLHFTKTGYTLQAKLFINALINTNNELEEKKYTINPLKIVGRP